MAEIASRRRHLNVNSVIGGHTISNARIAAMISQLGRLVDDYEARTPMPIDADKEAAVSVTFHVAGPLLAPDYTGIRTGRWNSDRALLVVQVAVPELSDADEMRSFLGNALTESVTLAEQYLVKKKLSLTLTRAKEIAERVATILRVQLADGN